MKTIFKYLILSVLFLNIHTVFAQQDTLFLINGKKLACKVLQINSTEVIYKKKGAADTLMSVNFATSISELQKILLADGTVEDFSSLPETPKPEIVARKTDTLYFTNGLVLPVHILEMDMQSVKYLNVGTENPPLVALSSELLQIRKNDGTMLNITSAHHKASQVPLRVHYAPSRTNSYYLGYQAGKKDKKSDKALLISLGAGALFAPAGLYCAGTYACLKPKVDLNENAYDSDYKKGYEMGFKKSRSQKAAYGAGIGAVVFIAILGILSAN